MVVCNACNDLKGIGSPTAAPAWPRCDQFDWRDACKGRLELSRLFGFWASKLQSIRRKKASHHRFRRPCPEWPCRRCYSDYKHAFTATPSERSTAPPTPMLQIFGHLFTHTRRSAHSTWRDYHPWLDDYSTTYFLPISFQKILLPSNQHAEDAVTRPFRFYFHAGTCSHRFGGTE